MSEAAETKEIVIEVPEWAKTVRVTIGKGGSFASHSGRTIDPAEFPAFYERLRDGVGGECRVEPVSAADRIEALERELAEAKRERDDALAALRVAEWGGTPPK